MLRHYGIDVQNSLVMDMQNQPFPVQTVRDAGGFQVQEIQALNYPFFVDVRADGMDQTAGHCRRFAQCDAELGFAGGGGCRQDGHRHRQHLAPVHGQCLAAHGHQHPARFNLYPDTGFPVEGETERSSRSAWRFKASCPATLRAKPNPLVATDATGAHDATVRHRGAD